MAGWEGVVAGVRKNGSFGRDVFVGIELIGDFKARVLYEYSRVRMNRVYHLRQASEIVYWMKVER